jgi:hypothetical protein
LNKNPTLEQILKFCPFDKLRNIDGNFMTKETFFSEMYYEDAWIDDLALHLYNEILSSIETNEIILIHGYSGLGKTTFLHYFMDIFSNFDHHYMDFNEILGIERYKEPVSELIKYNVRKFSSEKKVRTFSNLKDKSQTLYNTFSSEFIKKLENTDKKQISGQMINSLLDELIFTDVFLLFITLLFYEKSDKDSVIIYFDNLDAVDIEFLSNNFLTDFANAFDRATRLAQNEELFNFKVDFSSKYRFVLCLRDGNYSVLSFHIQDRFRSILSTIPFTIGFPDEYVRNIIQRRLDIATRYLREDNEVQDVISRIFDNINDSFFRYIYIHLFNNDIRKIIIVLFETVRNFYDQAWIDERGIRVTYGVQSIMLYGFIQYIKELGFFEDYQGIINLFDLENEGCCHPYRMILNFILNSSMSGINAYETNYQRSAGVCTLIQVIEAFIPIFPIKVILETIERLFLYHSKNWTQLISVYGFPILETGNLQVLGHEFENEFKKMHLEADGKTLTILPQKIKEKFNEIDLKINRAGIAYLRHIQSHFEFYAALLQKSTKPLFELGYSELMNINNVQFLLNNDLQSEILIKDVLRVIKNHYKNMESFFKTVFIEKLSFESEEYQRSDFSFKFSHNYKSSRGEFQSTRMLTFQIDYIDTFRLFILQLLSNEEAKSLFNQRMVNLIEIYIEMLHHTYDLSAKTKYDHFSLCVKKIKESEYRDFSLRIRLPIL